MPDRPLPVTLLSMKLILILLAFELPVPAPTVISRGLKAATAAKGRRTIGTIRTIRTVGAAQCLAAWSQSRLHGGAVQMSRVLSVRV